GNATTGGAAGGSLGVDGSRWTRQALFGGKVGPEVSRSSLDLLLEPRGPILSGLENCTLLGVLMKILWRTVLMNFLRMKSRLRVEK
ncbi:MAG TPA: hypothetical protein VH878_01680, partial [Thermodesulfobacteriota bacterium]